MKLTKLQVVKHLTGAKDYAKAAEMLGYANVQMVYNWPNQIGRTLRKAIILRMRANGIEVPESWKFPKP